MTTEVRVLPGPPPSGMNYGFDSGTTLNGTIEDEGSTPSISTLAL